MLKTAAVAIISFAFFLVGSVAVASAPPSMLMATEGPSVLNFDVTTGAFLGAFAQGPAMQSAYAMAFGPDGNLYVTDVRTGNVYRFNGQTGTFLDVLATVPECFEAVAFGPDGNLYLACAEGTVNRFSSVDGSPLGVFIEPTNNCPDDPHPPGVPPSGSPSGITFYGGSVFVTYTCFSSPGSLFQFDASTGKLTAELYDAFTANGPRSPVFAHDGTMYVPDWQTNDIAVFAPSTYEFQGNITDTNLQPLSLAFGLDGSLLAMNDPKGNDTVRRYDPTTGAFLSVLVAAGSGGISRGDWLLVPNDALECASCPAGMTCLSDGTCCSQYTCADQGAQCGTVSDGCGGDLSCGSCVSGTTCTNNLCTPTPEVVSSVKGGGSDSCNGTGDDAGTGLAYSGTRNVFAADDNGTTNSQQDWRYVLALLYGGLDLTAPGAAPDCNSSARNALVSNWSTLFQNGCSGDAANCGPRTFANGTLWHAFRPDDNSTTSAIFASLIGLSPNPSSSALNGFGTSPYCNAMNWDTSPVQAGACGEGTHDQFSGPGGILDPNSTYDLSGNNVGVGRGNHRKPASGTWGENPLGIPTQAAWDVLPTQMQDNDPIRRACIGTAVNNANHAGEEVCNLDGRLGLVLPVIDSAWLVGTSFRGGPPLVEYPTNDCNGFGVGAALQILNCAPRSAAHHDGECPNGDSEIGGQCVVPIDATNNRSDCVSGPSGTATLHVRPLPGNYGRAYNLQMRDGTLPAPSVGVIHYAQYPVSSSQTLDFAGAFYRIHQVESAVGPSLPACQLLQADDQIGCLVRSDPCSIGVSDRRASSWQLRVPGGVPGPDTAAVRINQLSPFGAGYPL